MIIKTTLKTFIRAEDGGAAFDWKVLGALVVAGGVIVGNYVYSGSETASGNLETVLQDENLPDKIFPGRAVD